jgi:hypothetical protein
MSGGDATQGHRAQEEHMAIDVDEQGIRAHIQKRLAEELDGIEDSIQVATVTPTGRPRSEPIFYVSIRNLTLGKSQTIKDRDDEAVLGKAKKLLSEWAEREIDTLVASNCLPA